MNQSYTVAAHDDSQIIGSWQGGSKTTNKLAIRVQLMKPVTWVPLIWGVACGAAASGKYNGKKCISCDVHDAVLEEERRYFWSSEVLPLSLRTVSHVHCMMQRVFV